MDQSGSRDSHPPLWCKAAAGSSHRLAVKRYATAGIFSTQPPLWTISGGWESRPPLWSKVVALRRDRCEVQLVGKEVTLLRAARRLLDRYVYVPHEQSNTESNFGACAVKTGCGRGYRNCRPGFCILKTPGFCCSRRFPPVSCILRPAFCIPRGFNVDSAEVAC